MQQEKHVQQTPWARKLEKLHVKQIQSSEEESGQEA